MFYFSLASLTLGSDNEINPGVSSFHMRVFFHKRKIFSLNWKAERCVMCAGNYTELNGNEAFMRLQHMRSADGVFLLHPRNGQNGRN